MVWKSYDPAKPLISIHLPKCAGTSMERFLRTRFQEKLHLHYPEEEGSAPVHHQIGAGHCVHGHFFHHEHAISVNDYYPDCDQFISVLREPLELAVSAWCYTRDQNSDFQSMEDYLTAILEWDRFYYYEGLPISDNGTPYEKQLANSFVWACTYAELEDQLGDLTKRLGGNTSKDFSFPHLNKSQTRFELPSEKLRQRFMEKFKKAYQLYHAVEKITSHAAR